MRFARVGLASLSHIGAGCVSFLRGDFPGGTRSAIVLKGGASPLEREYVADGDVAT